jgi:predicted aldo/keto reductase-like oxidoreductase
MKRRDFIKTAALSVPLAGMFPADLLSIERESLAGKLEKRSLGKTKEKLSIIGFGGIVVMDATTEQASSRVKEAIDYGVNYFDVAPSYGNAEKMLGPALEPYRKDVFLACKTTERSKEGSRKELEQSLKNLRTDHFDLYQLHAVTTLEDVEKIFNKAGAMETFLEAREEGKVRFLGFSAHSVEAALELMNRFNFDTVLFPFNYATWYAGNFGPLVMERAHEKEMGILALKAMARRPWQEGEVKTVSKTWYEPLINMEEANKGLRFTLSHPVTAAIPPGDEKLFSTALRLALDFKPLESKEIEEIKIMGQNTEPLFRYPMNG